MRVQWTHITEYFAKKAESWNIYGRSDYSFLPERTPDFLICAANKILKNKYCAAVFRIRSKLPLRLYDPTVPERNRLHH